MNLPLKDLTKKEWALWFVSLVIVGVSNYVSPKFDLLTLIAALIGVTSLIWGAKGNGWSMVLMVIFSALYGVISFRFHYWGEMVTYIGMTLPMSVWAAIEWFRNPMEDNPDVVKVRIMDAKTWSLLSLVTVGVTIAFFFILRYFHTPNLLLSTLSIITSFYAVGLTMLRSSYYPLFYAMNDIVLIIMWILASIIDPVYIPVIVTFAIFFINDLYGFYSWLKREKRIKGGL